MRIINSMAKSKQQISRKVQGRIARNKNVRYHNDAALFPDSVKVCKQCGKPFENRKRWSSRGQWHLIQYCSRRCRKLAKSNI